MQTHNPQTKSCQNKGKSKYCMGDFEITPDDFTFYDKIKVPPPTFCPTCRMISRMIWRNEISLYNRNCDLCNKNIVSIYSEDKPYKIYCVNCFHSDKWDQVIYQKEYDFSKSFFQQYKELQLSVPRIQSFVFQNTNSEYTNGAAFNKDSYLLFVSDNNENSMYSYAINDCKDVLDSMSCMENEFCYENIACQKCYKVFYSEECSNSSDLYFCKNCSNCTNCILSTNLRNKQYCILNKQYSKQEYEVLKEKLNLNSFSGVINTQKEFESIRDGLVVKYIQGISNSNCIGDFINHSKNSFYIYNSDKTEDSKYINYGNKIKSVYDAYVVVENSENCNQVVSAISLQNVISSYCVWRGFDILYSDTCENSNNLFGCIGLRNKSYCILNKQYTKEEYFELVPKIKQHMMDMPYIDKKGRVYTYGEFFPIELSPFAYNETVANDFYPLTKEEILEKGFTYREKETKNYTPTLTTDTIPDDIKDVPDTIIDEIIACDTVPGSDRCATAFKITEAELLFYRRLGIPLPRQCYQCRHKARFSKRNPLHLWTRTCMNQHSPVYNGPCQNTFETSYAPDRKELIYCEDCYKREVL